MEPSPDNGDPIYIRNRSTDGSFSPGMRIRVIPTAGCFGVLLALFSICILPLFLIDAIRAALVRLHLSPELAVLAVIGIVVGSIINIPIYKITRGNVQLLDESNLFGIGSRHDRATPWETIVAVNVGGCVIPVLLAVWQMIHLSDDGHRTLLVVLIVPAVNSLVCYRVARPVKGLGILMPGFVSPMTSVLMTWFMLGDNVFDETRVSVAFVAAVLGPLIGADLFHLKELKSQPAAMLSIGGAGTFDGIVMSGVIAALFA